MAAFVVQWLENLVFRGCHEFDRRGLKFCLCPLLAVTCVVVAVVVIVVVVVFNSVLLSFRKCRLVCVYYSVSFKTTDFAWLTGLTSSTKTTVAGYPARNLKRD